MYVHMLMGRWVGGHNNIDLTITHFWPCLSRCAPVSHFFSPYSHPFSCLSPSPQESSSSGYLNWRSLARSFTSWGYSGLQMGRRRMMKVRGMTVTASSRERPHCWTVSPPKAQQLKYLFRKKMMQNSKTVMNAKMTQKMQLLSSPLKMSSQSLILRQLKKLKICRKTKTLKTNVRCREQMWYLSKEASQESPLRGCSSPLTIVPSAWPWQYFAPRSVPMTWSNQSANSGRNYCPLRTRKSRRAIWQKDWIRMCLIIVFVISESDLLTGRCLSIFSVLGGSVDRAREARLSMIMLTQSIWTVVKTDCRKMEEEMMLKMHATTLTVSWNCRNFLIDSQMFLPQTMERTMELKLSSRMRMSDAFLATWVPDIPIATPTLARSKAGASLVPSPVTATTLFSRFRPYTNFNLCSGLLLDRILRCLTFWKNSVGVRFAYNFQNYSPSMHSPGVLSSALVMPRSSPTALAVTELSPVTMMTTTPARLHCAMASLLSGRSRSWIPASRSKVKPLFSRSLTPNLSLFSISAAVGSFYKFFTPMATTLKPLLVKLASSSSTAALSIGTMLLACGALLYMLSQALSTISLPPVRKRTFLLRQLMPVVILFLSELKGKRRNIFSQFWQRYWKRSFPAQNSSAYLRRAISVADPLGFGLRMEEELVAMEVQTRSLYQSPLLMLAKGERVMLFSWMRQLLPFHTYTTFMLFWVSVPVLSVQMTCAEPMVSQQASFLTKFFSYNICLTEKARERVTARGRPQGTATTIRVTANMRQLRMLAMCLLESKPLGMMSVTKSHTSSTKKSMTPEIKPNHPIFSAKSSSFSYSGVHQSTSS